MRHFIPLCSAMLMFSLASGAVLADVPAASPAPAPAPSVHALPAGGMTAAEVASWLQSGDFAASVESTTDGSHRVSSGSDGMTWHVYMFDCSNGDRCGSMQFYMGVENNGSLTKEHMNDWNRDSRWGRAYISESGKSWVEMDVDLSPGGSYEMLNDELATWRVVVKRYMKFINGEPLN